MRLYARFSPDGKQLIYHQRRHDQGHVLHFTVAYDLESGKAREIFQFDTFFKGNRQYRSNGYPTWSPDAKQVLWLVPRQKTDYSTLKMELLNLSTLAAEAKRLDLHERGLRFVMGVDWR